MRRLLLVVGIILLISIPLTFLLRGFTREVLLAFLIHLSWMVRLYIDSLPQSNLWAVFISFVLVIAALSLIKRKSVPRKTTEVEKPQWGKVHSLIRAIHPASQGMYFKWRLAQYLLDLSIETLAHRERTTPERIKQRLMSGTLEAPSEIEAYLLAGLTPVFTTPTNLITRIKQTLGLTPRISPLNLDPERVIQFLEDQLEIEYDR